MREEPVVIYLDISSMNEDSKIVFWHSQVYYNVAKLKLAIDDITVLFPPLNYKVLQMNNTTVKLGEGIENCNKNEESIPNKTKLQWLLFFPEGSATDIGPTYGQPDVQTVDDPTNHYVHAGPDTI